MKRIIFLLWTNLIATLFNVFHHLSSLLSSLGLFFQFFGLNLVFPYTSVFPVFVIIFSIHLRRTHAHTTRFTPFFPDLFRITYNRLSQLRTCHRNCPVWKRDCLTQPHTFGLRISNDRQFAFSSSSWPSFVDICVCVFVVLSPPSSKNGCRRLINWNVPITTTTTTTNCFRFFPYWSVLIALLIVTFVFLASTCVKLIRDQSILLVCSLPHVQVHTHTYKCVFVAFCKSSACLPRHCPGQSHSQVMNFHGFLLNFFVFYCLNFDGNVAFN